MHFLEKPMTIPLLFTVAIRVRDNVGLYSYVHRTKGTGTHVRIFPVANTATAMQPPTGFSASLGHSGNFLEFLNTSDGSVTGLY